MLAANAADESYETAGSDNHSGANHAVHSNYGAGAKPNQVQLRNLCAQLRQLPRLSRFGFGGRRRQGAQDRFADDDLAAERTRRKKYSGGYGLLSRERRQGKRHQEPDQGFRGGNEARAVTLRYYRRHHHPHALGPRRWDRPVSQCEDLDSKG